MFASEWMEQSTFTRCFLTEDRELNQARSKPDTVDRPAKLFVPLCTIIIVHNIVTQRQFFQYSHSSRPTSHLRCCRVEVMHVCTNSALCCEHCRPVLKMHTFWLMHCIGQTVYHVMGGHHGLCFMWVNAFLWIYVPRTSTTVTFLPSVIFICNLSTSKLLCQFLLAVLVPAHPGCPGERAIKRACLLSLLLTWGTASYYEHAENFFTIITVQKFIRLVKNWHSYYQK